LDQLEETVEPDDEWRAGMIEYLPETSTLACPKCGEAMRRFDYRAARLELDTCTQQHGYWLDAGETEDVKDAVEDRIKDLEEAAEAEAAWGAFLYKVRRPSWWDKLNAFLKG
jgi:Zn-finger nucleic acid-binding protein